MNLTNMSNIWSNVSNPIQIFQIANDNSGGLFWTMSYFLFMIILFFAMLGFSPEIALITSCFISLIPGLLLVYMGLISEIVLAIPIALIIVMIIYIITTSQKTQ
jgi:hypothetical protein